MDSLRCSAWLNARPVAVRWIISGGGGKASLIAFWLLPSEAVIEARLAAHCSACFCRRRALMRSTSDMLAAMVVMIGFVCVFMVCSP